MVRAGLIIDVQFGNNIDNLFGADGCPQAPAGHGEFFGEGIKDDAALSHARQRRERTALALIADIKIGLIAQNIKVVFADNLSKFFHLIHRAFSTGGVL